MCLIQFLLLNRTWTIHTLQQTGNFFPPRWNWIRMTEQRRIIRRITGCTETGCGVSRRCVQFMSHFPVDFSQLPTKAYNLWRKIECHARTITRYLWWARLRVLVPWPGLVWPGTKQRRIMRRKHNRSKSRRPVSGIKMSIRCAAPSTAVELCGRSSNSNTGLVPTNQTNQ